MEVKVYKSGKAEQWRNIFLMVRIVLLILSIFFLIWASIGLKTYYSSEALIVIEDEISLRGITLASIILKIIVGGFFGIIERFITIIERK